MGKEQKNNQDRDTGNSEEGISVKIHNCIFSGDPEMVIRSYGNLDSDETHSSIQIHDNIFLNKEQVTEGYSMAFSGVYGLDIHNNQITPIQGRGILLDAVGFGTIDGTYNTKIYDNTFFVYETRNTEYAATSLEVAAIRIRNWGGENEAHNELRIYNNTITASTDENGVHAAYGINITASAPGDDIQIYNNIINIDVSGNGNWGAALAMQHTGNTSATTGIFRNNSITSNSYGIGFDGNDGVDNTNWLFFENDLTASIAPIRFGMSSYYGKNSDISFYCNKIENNGVDGYPFYFTGTSSTTLIENNSITNNNTLYDLYSDSDKTSDVTFCNSGPTSNIDGGGLVATTNTCTNGINGCSNTAGSTLTANCSTDPSICDELGCRNYWPTFSWCMDNCQIEVCNDHETFLQPLINIIKQN